MYSANVNKSKRKLLVEMLSHKNRNYRKLIGMKQTTFMTSDCETNGKNKIFSVKIKNLS